MKLWFSICLCAFLVVGCSCLPVEFQHEDDVDSTAVIGKYVVDMGRKAIKRLLRGSTEVPTTAPYRLYEKPGSFAKAVEDFEKAKPRGGHEFTTPTGVGKVGRVGDRLLVIQRNNPDTGKPTIDIVKIDNASKSGDNTGVSGRLTERIVYKD